MQPRAATIRWFTDVDRAEHARVVREQLERDELLLTFARWLADRQDHDGAVTVTVLSSERETHLIRLLRDEVDPQAT